MADTDMGTDVESDLVERNFHTWETFSIIYDYLECPYHVIRYNTKTLA